MNGLKNFNFWNVQTETKNGLDFYKTYYRRGYAERAYSYECNRLNMSGSGGVVTLFENHEFVKEYVKEVKDHE